MAIDRSVVKQVPLCSYGFIIFLVVNVYLLWGVTLPASQAATLPDYDAIILPFRLGASSTMAIVPLLLVAVELGVAGTHKMMQRWLFPCAAVASVAGLLLFVGVATAGKSPLLYGLAGVLVGMGHSCCFVLWGIVLAQLSPQGCLFVLLLSGVGSGLLNLALFSAPSTLGYTVVAVLLLLSLVGLHSSLRDLPALPSGRSEASSLVRLKTLVVSLGQPLLCVCALGLAFNVFREVAFAQVGETALVNAISMLGLIMGTGAVLAVLMLFKVQAPEVGGVYPVATLVVAACMLPFPFIGASLGLPFVFVISVFYLLVETLFKGTVAHHVRTSGEPALLVFAFGFGVEFAAMALGSYIGALPRGAGGESQVMYVVALALLCMYLLVVPLVSAHRKRKGRPAEVVQERVVIRQVDADELRRRCEAIAGRSGITQSELSVMTLLAAGMTASAISRELSLSENTIRSHSKSIYRKLDVHSKQQLIDLVGNYDESED